MVILKWMQTWSVIVRNEHSIATPTCYPNALIIGLCTPLTTNGSVHCWSPLKPMLRNIKLHGELLPYIVLNVIDSPR